MWIARWPGKALGTHTVDGCGDEKRANESPSPEFGLVPEGKSGSFALNKFEFREKLAPFAGGHFLALGGHGTFALCNVMFHQLPRYGGVYAIPSTETARVHIAARQRGGVAARGARAIYDFDCCAFHFIAPPE